MAAKAKTKEELQSVGYNLAAQMYNAEVVMNQTKRERIMSVVKQYHDADAITAILEGYTKFYIDKGAKQRSADNRKTELKAVFEAVAKTEVTGDNLKKLEAFEGEYNAFIAFARELKGKVTRAGGGAGRVKKELTKVQQGKIHEQLSDANENQLIAIAKDAVTNIWAKVPRNKEQAPEKATLAGKQTLLVIQANALALQKNDKADEFFHDIAGKILDIVVPAIEQIEANEAKAAEIATMAQGEKQAA